MSRTTTKGEDLTGFIATRATCQGRGRVVLMDGTPRVCPYCESAYCLEKQL